MKLIRFCEKIYLVGDLQDFTAQLRTVNQAVKRVSDESEGNSLQYAREHKNLRNGQEAPKF